MTQGVKNQLCHQQYIYDFAVDGGAVSTITLSNKDGKSPIPVGAIVKTVYAQVLSACTSDGSATVEWGNNDTDGYSGAGIAVASLTANSVFNGYDNASPLLWDDTNDHPIYYPVVSAATGSVTITIATAALTAGKIAINVEYFIPAGDL